MIVRGEYRFRVRVFVISTPRKGNNYTLYLCGNNRCKIGEEMEFKIVGLVETKKEQNELMGISKIALTGMKWRGK